jgi:hypothetical protein
MRALASGRCKAFRKEISRNRYSLDRATVTKIEISNTGAKVELARWL